MTTLNSQSLQELIDAHGAALTLYARQWCRSPDDAVQEAFIQLARQQPPPNQLVGWLYVAVRHRAMNLARSEARYAQHMRAAGEIRDAWFTPPAADAEIDPDFDFEMLLEELPLLEREIVVARIWGDLSFAQIAELVSHPLSTVHRRYQQALSFLAVRLNTQETKGGSHLI